MGLPLYIAPVESDIRGKPSSKAPAQNARTTIRRDARHRNSEAYRETRRRALVAARYGHPELWLSWTQSAADDAGVAGPPVSHSTSVPPAPDFPSASTRGARRDFTGSRAELDEHAVSRFGERWANLHAHANPSSARGDRGDGSPRIADAPMGSDAWDMSVLDSNATRRRAILQAEPEPSRRRLPPSPPPPPMRRFHTIAYERATAARRAVRRTARSARPSLLNEPTERPQEARFDGLGDRDRSLSPEADYGWDTLLSTLTPDPQPLSVGSSFASASASAVASQSAGSQSVAAGSSSTSLTGPEADPAEDSNIEPPCESGCEQSDTEGDDGDDGDDDEDDDDMEQNTLTRFPPGLQHSRSYADVAAHITGIHGSSNSSSGLDFLRGMGGMQRIMRNLAAREDIPDEWWAEAGLSRSLSREGST